MKKMLIIHHCDGWGGAGVSLLYCYEMLKEKYDITICLPHIDSEVGKRLSEEKELTLTAIEDEMAMISAYSGGPSTFSRTFWKYLFKISKTSKKIENIIRADDYNVVVLNSVTLSWISKITNRLRIPSIVYIRETKVNNIGFGISKYLINKYSNGVLFISNYDKKDLNLRVINQQVWPDVVKFKDSYKNTFDIQTDNYVIAYLGGDGYIKGYDLVKKIIQSTETKEYLFVVAGDVSDSQKVKSDNVKYVGNVLDVGNILAYSDVVLFPANSPHQGRPIFEAGAFKIPAIATDFEQIKENLIDGYNGFVFPQYNDSVLLKQIKKCADNELRKRLGENNYKLYKINHSIEGCKELVCDFFKKVEGIY